MLLFDHKREPYQTGMQNDLKEAWSNGRARDPEFTGPAFPLLPSIRVMFHIGSVVKIASPALLLSLIWFVAFKMFTLTIYTH